MGWTFKTLKTLLESEINAVRDSVRAAQEAAIRADAKADAANEKRFDAGNEIKEALKNAQDNFPQKAEVNARFNAVNEKLDKLDKARTAWEAGQTGVKSGWAIAVAVALFALAVYLGLQGRTP